MYLHYISTISPLYQVSRGGVQPPSPAKRSSSKGSFKEQKPAPPQKKMSTDDLIQALAPARTRTLTLTLTLTYSTPL